jgi:hypothetical protein
MFNGLSFLPKPTETPVVSTTKNIKANTTALLNSAAQVYESLERLSIISSKLGGILVDYRDLKLVKEIATTDGLSRGLIRLMNRTGKAHQVLTSLPAIEKLDNVVITPKDRRSINTIKDIDKVLATEAMVVHDLARKAGDEMSSLYDHMKSHLDNMDMSHTELHDRCNAMPCTEGHMMDVKKHTIECEPLMRKCNLIKDAMMHINDEHPAEEKCMPLDKICNIMNEHTGMVCGDKHDVTCMHHMIHDHYTPMPMASLHERGYRPEHMPMLMNHAKNMSEDMRAMMNRKGELMDEFKMMGDGMDSGMSDGDMGMGSGQNSVEAAPSEENMGGNTTGDNSLDNEDGAVSTDSPGDDASALSSEMDPEFCENHIHGCVIVITKAIQEGLMAIHNIFDIVSSVMDRAEDKKDENDDIDDEPLAEEPVEPIV